VLDQDPVSKSRQPPLHSAIPGWLHAPATIFQAFWDRVWTDLRPTRKPRKFSGSARLLRLPMRPVVPAHLQALS